MTKARASQSIAEVVSNVTAKARASQCVVEAVSTATTSARISQSVAELLSTIQSGYSYSGTGNTTASGTAYPTYTRGPYPFMGSGTAIASGQAELRLEWRYEGSGGIVWEGQGGCLALRRLAGTGLVAASGTASEVAERAFQGSGLAEVSGESQQVSERSFLGSGTAQAAGQADIEWSPFAEAASWEYEGSGTILASGVASHSHLASTGRQSFTFPWLPWTDRTWPKSFIYLGSGGLTTGGSARNSKQTTRGYQGARGTRAGGSTSYSTIHCHPYQGIGGVKAGKAHGLRNVEAFERGYHAKGGRTWGGPCRESTERTHSGYSAAAIAGLASSSHAKGPDEYWWNEWVEV